METVPERVDLAVIGGGINGCAIARDAVGRGLSVLLCEQGDLAQATSSASTKLFHGGLRYLEYFEFRLVRESLIERENLLRAMPHISWPMRFVLPHTPDLRPAWMLRLGLLIYDNLGGRSLLPATRTLDLTQDPAGRPLRPGLRRAYEYSDCWVDDARLVVLTARDAAERGACILTRTRFERAELADGDWRLHLVDTRSGQPLRVSARAVVNASGPWVGDVIRDGFGRTSRHAVRLVRGSHIVTRKLFEHDRAYILQQPDKRIVFAIPYEEDFTLVGTTDVEHTAAPSDTLCTMEERDYLLDAASRYFRNPVQADDIVWSYSGVRPLYDDGASSATAATRDYVLELHGEPGQGPAVDVFGGKITTHRRLAEATLAKLKPTFPEMGDPWTTAVALPGGAFPSDGAPAIMSRLRETYPFLTERWARRLTRSYGADSFVLLGDARSAADLGLDFGATLTEREVDWLRDKEWARTTEDILWRRSKLGLHMNQADRDRLAAWLATAPEASALEPMPEGHAQHSV
jgi:glycerol-3-phosphate dehydrogenase